MNTSDESEEELMISLLIEASGERPQTRIEVSEDAMIGDAVASLVEQLEYPKMDNVGNPLTYNLRLMSTSQSLPNTIRFADAHIRSGEHWILEPEGALDATIPVESLGGIPDELASQSLLRRRWPRRALFPRVLAGFSIAGLGGGLLFSFAQYLFSRAGASRTRPSTPTIRLRGANKQLTFSEHKRTIRAMAWSPDGIMLASGGDDSQVLIWKPVGTVEQRIPHTTSVQALAWSPESLRLVTGAGTRISFFSALSGTLLSHSTHHHTATISSLAWTPKNQLQVVSGSSDKRAIIWETVNYQAQTTFTRHNTPIQSVTWARDGITVASSSSGGAVRVWNAETAQEVHNFYQDAPLGMRACSFEPTGTALAVGANDGILRVWNDGLDCRIQTVGNDLRCQDIPKRMKASGMAIRSIAWSTDGRYIASGNDDGSFSLWIPAEEQLPLFTIMITPGLPIHSLAWSPNNTHLATASGDTVILWLLH